ncbi:MAG: enhanced serine sensitivity protein SseB C-terminal domain-containing protein [Roseburia sp.]
MEITNERKEELLNKFLLNYNMPEREDLADVSFEELEFLIRSAQIFHDKKEMTADNLLEKRDRYTELLMSRLWKLDGIYIAGDPNTQYPHIMGDGSIMIFSTEELANKASAHYEEQGLALEIQYVPKDGMTHFFTDCYWWGMELLVLDMGTYSVHINRTKLMPLPDEKKIPKAARPVRNPAFMAATIQHRQLLFREERDEKWTRSERAMCDRMLRELVRGRYLCPVKITTADGKPVDHNSVMTLKEGATIRFAMLGDNEKRPWLPAFTDWDAFFNMYQRDEWNAQILTYEDLVTVSKENGIVINPGSMETRIDANRKKVLEGYLQRYKRLQKEKEGGMLRDCGNGISIGASVESTSELEQILADFLKTQKDVKRAFLAVKVVQDSDIAYLLVLDMKENEKSVLEGIAQTVQGKLGALRLEIRKADEAVLAWMEGMTPFYKKGLFGL